MTTQISGTLGVSQVQPGVVELGDLTVAAKQVLFSKYFESTDQTITAAALLTIPHGLGTTPKLWFTYLRCVTADAGYSVGDVLMDPGFTGAAGLYGAAFVPDAVNLVARVTNNASSFGGTHKTTGASAAFTSASWRIFVRAWA